MDSCEHYRGTSLGEGTQKDMHSQAVQNIVIWVEQHCHKMFRSQVKSQK